MLQFAYRHYRALTWQPDTLVHFKTFRTILALCTNSCYFCRAEIGVRYHTDDIAVDMTGGNTLLLERKANGDYRRTADLLEAYTAGHTKYCN
jgi:hypothetical protein